jgi:hypothetical protein
MMVLVLGMQLERATWPERPSMVIAASFLSLVATRWPPSAWRTCSG